MIKPVRLHKAKVGVRLLDPDLTLLSIECVTLSFLFAIRQRKLLRDNQSLARPALLNGMRELSIAGAVERNGLGVVIGCKRR